MPFDYDHIFEEKSSSLLPVRKYMEVSTGHITQADSELLYSDCHSNCPTIIVYEKGEYGYWVYIPHDVAELEQPMKAAGYSHWFVALIREARIAGACWLCLERDGAISNHLPSFQW